MRQVMPRVGSLFEPMFGTRAPTVFERDEATEGVQEQASRQPTEMDSRRQERNARWNETTAPPDFVADPRPDVHQALQLFPTAQTLPPMLSAMMDATARQIPSQADGPSSLLALDASQVRDELREPGTLHLSTGKRASRDDHPGATPRSAGIRPAVAAMDRPRAEKLPRTVRIEIGRIEIRATSSPTRPHTQPPAGRPRQSLEEYLQHQGRPTR